MVVGRSPNQTIADFRLSIADWCWVASGELLRLNQGWQSKSEIRNGRSETILWTHYLKTFGMD